jgi:hypothetical protein
MLSVVRAGKQTWQANTCSGSQPLPTAARDVSAVPAPTPVVSPHSIRIRDAHFHAAAPLFCGCYPTPLLCIAQLCRVPDAVGHLALLVHVTIRTYRTVRPAPTRCTRDHACCTRDHACCTRDPSCTGPIAELELVDSLTDPQPAEVSTVAGR